MGNIAMYGDFHPTEYHVGAVRKCKSEILDNENWADRWPSDLLQEGSGVSSCSLSESSGTCRNKV